MAQKMSQKSDSLVNTLVKTNPRFRSLHKEHQTLEARLFEMDRQKHLTEEEQVERRNLQKQKLQGKDRMEQILRGESI